MWTSIDHELRRIKTCFQKNSSCSDQVSTLRIIFEQCQEFHALDLKKALNEMMPVNQKRF
jgi:hypothetical protein